MEEAGVLQRELSSEEIAAKVTKLCDTEPRSPRVSFDDKNLCQFCDNNLNYVKVSRVASEANCSSQLILHQF